MDKVQKHNSFNTNKPSSDSYEKKRLLTIQLSNLKPLNDGVSTTQVIGLIKLYTKSNNLSSP
jgi:hypothetical protein